MIKDNNQKKPLTFMRVATKFMTIVMLIMTVVGIVMPILQAFKII